MLAWFGLALGLLTGAGTAYSETVEKLWHPAAYLLFPLSGAAFMVEWLPESARSNLVAAADGARRRDGARRILRPHGQHALQRRLYVHGLHRNDVARSCTDARREPPAGVRDAERRRICRKVYRTRRGLRSVLDGITFDLRKGENLGIIGRNGAGKSTLIRLLSGAEEPTSGRIDRGMSVSWPLAFTGAFQPNLTGLDNLKFVCRIHGVNYRSRVAFVEEFTELGRYFREPVSTYSHGMITRLGFALSMAIEFDCFLIDEAMVVGDARFHQRCHDELFHKRKDRAFILVSHSAQCHQGVLLACSRSARGQTASV